MISAKAAPVRLMDPFGASWTEVRESLPGFGGLVPEPLPFLALKPRRYRFQHWHRGHAALEGVCTIASIATL